jgi:hypothetical protein
MSLKQGIITVQEVLRHLATVFERRWSQEAHGEGEALTWGKQRI